LEIEWDPPDKVEINITEKEIGQKSIEFEKAQK
jgi:hypothetical protein